MSLFLIASTIGLGTLLAIQVAVNGRLRVRTDEPVHAALISTCISTISLLLYSTLVVRQPVPDLTNLKSAPWWIWTGGLMGAAYVAFSLVLVTRLGGAMFLALVVVGQMSMAMVMDHFGLFGLTRHEISPLRVLGASFLVVGVVLIRRF
jgi:bacterial/archaeal transporter family-2 protein